MHVRQYLVVVSHGLPSIWWQTSHQEVDSVLVYALLWWLLVDISSGRPGPKEAPHASALSLEPDQ